MCAAVASSTTPPSLLPTPANMGLLREEPAEPSYCRTSAQSRTWQGSASTTLPPSEPEVVLEAPPAVRAAEEHAGQCGHDPSAHGGQARRGGGGGVGRPP